jgi:hypothetical protein
MSLQAITSTTSIPKTSADNSSALCASLTPIDVDSANKPGVVDYDTDIGSDGNVLESCKNVKSSVIS